VRRKLFCFIRPVDETYVNATWAFINIVLKIISFVHKMFQIRDVSGPVYLYCPIGLTLSLPRCLEIQICRSILLYVECIRDSEITLYA
jgi:hypothetical protein